MGSRDESALGLAAGRDDHASDGSATRDCGGEQSGERNATLLAAYVARYFHDLAEHIASVATRIVCGGRVHYVVGNSKFYGVLVPTETAFAELLAENGFDDVEVRVLRKRNSKKELFEYDVVGTKR